MTMFWEVRMRNTKGATELASFATEEAAVEKLDEVLLSYPMVSLLTLERDSNGDETQTHALVYHNGELYNTITEPYRRTKMESQVAAETLNGVIPEDVAAKAAAKAEAKAAKEAEKAEKKAAREAARAEKAAAREELKAAKAAARAEAIARGEKVGVRGGKWSDAAVITFGPAYTGTNPKRANTLAFESFSHYKEGMTVKEYRESGAPNPLGNLNWDSDRGFIVITDSASGDVDGNTADAGDQL